MIKQTIKRIILSLKYYSHKANSRYSVNDNYDCKRISFHGKSVFFGYYDLKPVKYGKHLLHMLSTDAVNGRDAAEIGYYNLETETFTTIERTYAWSFQQGSRLRWGNGQYIYYNDYENEHYVTKKYNLEKEESKIVANNALYDISKDESFGISVNFNRLQTLRPGYGYSNARNYNISQDDLDNDGLIYVGLNSNDKKVLVSLRELSSGIHYDCYINHVAISPESDKIMYFLLWNEGSKRRSKLYVYDLSNKENRLIDDSVLVSHYSWMDNHSLIITCVNNGQTEYRIYNIDSDGYEVLDHNTLNTDGHPTFINDHQFVSDTYPIKGVQRLFRYDIKDKKYELISSLYAHPALTGEQRCDLHPKVSDGYFSIDTTCFGKYRSIMTFRSKIKHEQ